MAVDEKQSLKSGGQLERVLQAGEFAITAETGPPDSANAADVLARAGCLKGLADAVNVLDGAGARAHLSPLATAAILAQAGIEPVIQFTMRDRNRLALEGDVLGAAALGVHSLLCLTGDSVEAGDQPDAKPVFDLKSNEFMEIVRAMRDDGTMPSGRALKAAPRLLIGGADAPFDPPSVFEPNGLKAKIASGADFFQTQFCFDLEMLRRYLARLDDFGIPDQAPIIVGIGPLRSAKSARWMNENLFGVSIPEPVIERLEAAQDPRAEGIKICIELMQELREIKGVAGAHLMAPHGEAACAEAIAESGIVRDRSALAD
jgi:methylenetetrahydrofolate reductase (NADPH)